MIAQSYSGPKKFAKVKQILPIGDGARNDAAQAPTQYYRDLPSRASSDRLQPSYHFGLQ